MIQRLQNDSENKDKESKSSFGQDQVWVLAYTTINIRHLLRRLNKRLKVTQRSIGQFHDVQKRLDSIEGL